MRSGPAVAAAVAAALLAAAGCRPGRAPAVTIASGDITALELAGEFNIPPLTTFDRLKNARFGGVSGITIDRASGELLGICDDRDQSRVFVFRPPALPPAQPFRLDLHAYFPLPTDNGAPDALDPEGIAISRTGRLFVASEGVQNGEPRTPPAVLEYTRNYSFVRQLPVPDKFHPAASGPAARGVRGNAAFESLTITPDDRRLYTASETPLLQDGEEAGPGRAALVRILEYEADGDTFAPRREFAYPVDPLPAPAFTPRYVVTGLVELLATSHTGMLALERGFAEEAGDHPRSVNHIRIFRLSFDGATDISAMDSIRGRRDVIPVRKTLLLDLGSVKGLSPELANLDNFEGMAFGPSWPDGSRSLLLVSDDNFNPRQRTSFLLFRIR